MEKQRLVWLLAWLLGCLVGGLFDPLTGWLLAGWLVRWHCLVIKLVGWLHEKDANPIVSQLFTHWLGVAGWLLGWLVAGWLVCWLVLF